MHVRWYGQSAFLLSDGKGRLMVDPFGDGEALAARGRRFEVVWLDEPEFDAAALAGGEAAMSLVIPRAPLA